jgi:hypothetical protein
MAKIIVEHGKLIPVEDEGAGHNRRVCRVGPVGKLYIALGQRYNVPPKNKMDEFNKWGIGDIIRMNLDGSITRGIEIMVAVASVTANTGSAAAASGRCGHSVDRRSAACGPEGRGAEEHTLTTLSTCGPTTAHWRIFTTHFM